MDIDWSKAPEGATHYCMRDKAFWVQDATSVCSECIPRPERLHVEWNGEGLPPVGCECEYRIGGGPARWYRCTVKYVLAGDPHEDADEWSAVVWCPHLEKDQVAHPPLFEFRPLRTKEQRQREEVFESIDADIEDFNLSIDCSAAIARTVDAILSRYNLEPKT